jgi:hypothetical protein
LRVGRESLLLIQHKHGHRDAKRWGVETGRAIGKGVVGGGPYSFTEFINIYLAKRGEPYRFVPFRHLRDWG